MRSGNIQNLGSLLAKYKNLRAPQETVVKVFLEEVKEVCGITLPKRLVTYKTTTKTLFVATSGPGKTEITLSKKRLLAKCLERLGEEAPQAIV